MALRRRAGRGRAAEFAEGVTVAPSEAPLDEALGPAELFLRDHKESLETSTHTWVEVSEALEPFTNGEVAAQLEAFYNNFLDHKRGMTQAEKARQKQIIKSKLTRLPGDLATYLLVYVHAKSRDSTFPTSTRSLVKDTSTNSEKVNIGLAYLLDDEEHGAAILPLPGMVSEARGVRKHVVNDLVLAAGQNSNIFQELCKVANTDPKSARLVEELKKICGVDWHITDPELSMLRDYIRCLQQEDGAFVDEFVLAVSEVEESAKNGEEKLARIKSMAKFALAAQGIDISSTPDIQAVLTASRQHWPQFAEVETAYQEFKRRKVVQAERDILAFVGPSHLAHFDIRSPHSADEFIEAMEHFDFYFDPSRVPKRTRAHRERRRRLLPSSHQIAREAAVSKEAARQLEPALIKKTPSGYILDPFDMEHLLKSVNGDQTMRQEMEAAIESLLGDPMGPGTKRLMRETHARVGSDTFKMRRFSPSGRPDLSTQSIARWRVTYGVSETHVGVYQVEHHDRFAHKE